MRKLDGPQELPIKTTSIISQDNWTPTSCLSWERKGIEDDEGQAGDVGVAVSVVGGIGDVDEDDDEGQIGDCNVGVISIVGVVGDVDDEGGNQVIVLGAGYSGLTTAAELTLRGFKVYLLRVAFDSVESVFCQSSIMSQIHWTLLNSIFFRLGWSQQIWASVLLLPLLAHNPAGKTPSSTV